LAPGRAANDEEAAIMNIAGTHPALASELEALAGALRRSTVQVRGRGPGGGSGIVWGPDGLILTNAHVARGPRLEVELADGRVLPATLGARDPELDLASLRVEAHDLPAAAVGDSAELRVGQLVFAAGHPFGVTGAVTAGIVHGFGGSPGGAEWVLADLRLAPGNSGGPLADARGRVVGVNSMISGGRAFAIPSHVVQRFLASPSATPTLGVELQPVAVRGDGGRSLGLLVLEVAPASAAERAGVLAGDVLLGAAGRRFRAGGDLRRALREASPSAALELELLRAGRPIVLPVQLEVRPPLAEAA
jgi:serine protease Do